jgi:hypothetical protein
MQRQWTLVILVLLLGLGVSGIARAQGGSFDATIEGTVSLADGSPAPGVLVTVTSPALQGSRTTTSQETGGFILRGLPPGVYRIQFELQGFKNVQAQVTVPLGGRVHQDGKLVPETVTETITVTDLAVSALERPTVQENLTYKTVDSLAIPRDIASIAALAPGANTNTPLGGQIQISGGEPYDNLFLLNGVDIADNVFGSADDLYIEDAVQETQVLSSAVSAEYGRFGGGVINAVTKSGGNAFSGTFRTDISNPKYRSNTPLEDAQGTKRTDKNNLIYSATLGGFILKDKLWFFLAGRDQSTTTQQALFATGINFNSEDVNKRYEGKLTANFSNSHSLQAAYTDNDTKQVTTSESADLTDSTLDTVIHPHLPNTLRVLHYSGVLTSAFYLEGQYSEKKFRFADFGGTSKNIVDSPFTCQTVFGGACAYNAPHFDATDPEDRNNKQYEASGSYFLQAAGSHDIKVGGESFESINTGGNSQTSTGYEFVADPLLDANGNIVLDAQGHAIPVFIPGQTGLINWIATRGARSSITTSSAYVNDVWRLDNHWSFNLGARYEKASSDATGGIKNVHTSSLNPRLAVTFDPLANGKFRLAASYAQYANSYSFGIFSNGTMGSPEYLYGPYMGPAGQGRDFAPGFDPNNYVFVSAGGGSSNTRFANNVGSPITREATLSAGVQLSHAGLLRLTYINRRSTNLVEAFTTRDLGTTDIVINGVQGPTVDNVVYKNSDVPKREYQALLLEGRATITPAWTIEGNWAHELKENGNYEGQVSNFFPSAGVEQFPELFDKARSFPEGRLQDYERDLVRLWTIYNLDFHQGGALSLSLLGQYHSPLTYSLVATAVPLTPEQMALNPGYSAPPRNQTVYFGSRGSQEFKAWKTLDVAALYSVPIFRSLSPYLKVDVRNVLNDRTLIGWDSTVTPDPNSPKDALGLPTGFIKASSFGQARSNSDYPLPREYRFALGIRF